MRSTGRLFLKINDAVDERNDPIRATEAAAKLLKGNYESLRTWPLAVTAYNHGRKGMMRAVRKVGSEELEDVVDDYRSALFRLREQQFFHRASGRDRGRKACRPVFRQGRARQAAAGSSRSR